MMVKVKPAFQIFFITLLSILLLFAMQIPVQVFAATSLSLSSNTGSPGTTINVTGSFDTVNNGVATITFNDTYMGIATISSGHFSGSFQVPVLPRGKYTLSVKPEGSTESVSSEFTIVPQISVNDNEVSVGDQITITGNGFSSGTVFIYIDNSSTPLITTTANESGILSPLTMTVPALNKAVHIIRAVDNAGTASSVYTTFSVIPKITLSDTASGAGSLITITGTGFASSSMIKITLNAITMSASAVVTDYTGSFISSVTLPVSMSKGNCTITATDNSGNVAIASLLIKQSISISKDTGLVNDSITVSGTSFDPNKTVSIYFNNIIITSTQTDSYGTFSVVFAIPVAAQGEYLIKAIDSNSNEAIEHFTVEPYLVISPTVNKTGTNVNVSGNGFAASSSITVFFDNANIVSVQTTVNGTFIVDVVIPPSSHGEHSIKVIDGEENQSTAVFTTVSDLKSDIGSGFYNDTIVLTGTGFASGNSYSNIITFTIGNNTLVMNEGNIFADPSGSFIASFSIPELSKGTHVITATDTYGNAASIPLTVNTIITADILTGVAGDEVQISGYGFAPNKKIDIKYNNNIMSTSLGTVTTSINGSFISSFILPDITAGTYVLEANDGTNSAFVTFIQIYESVPPPPVSLISPIDKVKSPQPVIFNWNPSSDPSGVFYKIQVGTDATFSTLRLDVDDITATTYTMNAESKLDSVSAKNPYYWRVKAIDGVGNESAWVTDTFIIGSGWPVWLTYTLIGIAGFLILILLGFWIGRRMAMTRSDSKYNYNMDTDIEYRYREQYPDASLDSNS
jgi:hypothetical protein